MEPWYKGITNTQWHTLIAGFVGWALDVFDLLIYNFTIVSLIKEYGLTTVETGMVASISMVATAVGGVIFGWVSDRYGRKRSLMITIVIFTIGTTLCGLSQSIWQLMAFRCIVGLGLGGEWACGASLVSESWPKEHRGKALAIMQAGYSIGGMAAALLSGPIIAEWGWRTLYFVGIPPAIIMICYILKYTKEPEIWVKNCTKTSENQSRTSIFTIFKGNLIKVTLLGTLFCSLTMAATYPYAVWLPTYLATPVAQGGAGFSMAKGSWFVFPYYLGAFFGALAFGFLSDKFGRRKVFAGFLVMAFVMVFTSMRSAHVPAFFVSAVLMAGFFKVGCYAGFGPLLAEIFPTKVRAMGQGFCYNIGRGMGALSISTVGIVAASAGLANAIMIAGSIFLISAMVIFMLPETVGKELE